MLDFEHISDRRSNRSEWMNNDQGSGIDEETQRTAWSMFDEVTSTACSRNCSLSLETLIDGCQHSNSAHLFDRFSSYQMRLKRFVLVICSFNRLVKATWNWLNIRWSIVLQSQTRQTLASPITPNRRRDPLEMKANRFRRKFDMLVRRWWYSRSFSGRHVNTYRSPLSCWISW